MTMIMMMMMMIVIMIATTSIIHHFGVTSRISIIILFKLKHEMIGRIELRMLKVTSRQIAKPTRTER